MLSGERRNRLLEKYRKAVAAGASITFLDKFDSGWPGHYSRKRLDEGLVKIAQQYPEIDIKKTRPAWLERLERHMDYVESSIKYFVVAALGCGLIAGIIYLIVHFVWKYY